jgi:predicted secreted Zn-dependent protease
LNEAGDQCESKKDKTGKVTQTVLKKLDIEAQARYDRYLEILTKLTAKAEA